MQIQVTFRHVTPSNVLKEYARGKLSKIQKFLDTPIEASITLGVEKHRYEADVIILTNGYKIHGAETTGDLYSAIDLVIEKLERQVKRYREKLKKFIRDNKKGKDMSLKVGILEAESIVEEEPKVIKINHLIAKPMDIDEAAMQLDFSQDNFLVFVNVHSQVLNVIYRRSDGNFGLIEPQ